MPTLIAMIPDASTAIRLEPEELGGILLRHLAGLNLGDQNLSRFNFFNVPTVTFHGYPANLYGDLSIAFEEAWAWLENQGLIVADVGSGAAQRFRLTRRGRRVATSEEAFEGFRRASLLPSDLLHPRLREVVGSLFLRDDYDTAIFKAFREVEVSVRRAAGLADRDIGVPLMHKAFEPKAGPLTNQEEHESERVALMSLFAGAIGVFKNPTSHRNVEIDDPKQAVAVLLLASQLLWVVDSRYHGRG